MFMEIKGKSVSETENYDWNRDLEVLVDITWHFNEVNQKLLTQNQLVHELYSHIKAFQRRLHLWERELRDGDMYHFLTIASHPNKECIYYAEEIAAINSEFLDRFQDFNSEDADFTIFSNPFCSDVHQAPNDLQMKLIDLKAIPIFFNRNSKRFLYYNSTPLFR